MALHRQPNTADRGVRHDVAQQVAAVSALDLAFQALLSRDRLQLEGFDELSDSHSRSFPKPVAASHAWCCLEKDRVALTGRVSRVGWPEHLPEYRLIAVFRIPREGCRRRLLGRSANQTAYGEPDAILEFGPAKNDVFREDPAIGCPAGPAVVASEVGHQPLDPLRVGQGKGRLTGAEQSSQHLRTLVDLELPLFVLARKGILRQPSAHAE